MQGRSKRDSSAAAEQEPRGASERGASAQHTRNRTAAGPSPEGNERATRPETANETQAAAPRAAASPGDAGSRIALRNWRISTRLVSLLALPVIAATTLGALRIDDSINNINQLDHMQLLTELTKEATALAAQLQTERDQEAGPLSHGVQPSDLSIKQLQTQTDRASKSFLNATNAIGNTNSDDTLNSIRANVNQIAGQVQQISDLRSGAYSTPGSSSLTVDSYDQLITSLLSLSQDMAQATNSPDMIKRTRALAAFSSAKEYASIQRAIIAAALPADPKKHTGKLTESDRLYGAAAAKKETNELNTFRTLYQSMGGNADDLMAPLQGQGSPEIKAADDYESRVFGGPDGLANQPNRSYADWIDQASVRINTMKTIESTLLGQVEAKATELRQQSQRDAIINGAVILLVLGVSLAGAFIVARSMVRSLRRLQDTATKVAQDRLPELVRELSESDPQDVDTSVESVGVHSRDEIGKVAAAFDHVHREAVRLAAEQALLRGNVNAMFTNLSRRSQGLIQRQLSLISELESREADPDQLSSLFKLDHLATRMRRNGENLLVLAGEEPGRRWTRPVPLVDVLRAAASEVEQYERIELAAVPATEVAGRVVNDLVHLLAELLENATSFSSPQTKVRVTGHALPDGRVLVEIHDTGIGLSPEDLAAINERLASPPTVDVSVSRRMGLFVVGRLSLRHGIRIQLRPSDSGGTTALVMLPVDLAQGGKKAPAQPGAAGGRGGQAPNAPQGRLAAGPGADGPAGGGKPGLGSGPGGGLAGLGTGNNKLGAGAGASRGQVGAGAAPRAALPSRDAASSAPRGGAPNAGGGQDRGATSIFAQNAFGAGQQPQGSGEQEHRDRQAPRGPGADQGPATAQMPAVGGGHAPEPAAGFDQGGGRFGQGRQDRELPVRDDVFGGPRDGRTAGDAEQSPRGGFSGRAQNAFPQAGGRAGGEGPGARQLPPPGMPRAELPGGPGAASSGHPQERMQLRPSLDAPRGHDDAADQFGRPRPDRQDRRPDQHSPRPDDRQGPGSTAEFARPDFSAQAGAQDPQATGQFARPGFDAAQQGYDAQGGYTDRRQEYGQGGAPGYGAGPGPARDTGQNPAYGTDRPQAWDDRQGRRYDTGPNPVYDTGRGQDQGFAPSYGDSDPSYGRQTPAPQGYDAGQQGYGQQQDFSQQRGRQGGVPPQPQQQDRRPQQPDALPPAPGPGDGRTPLYDTLETNWFHGGGQQQGTAPGVSAQGGQDQTGPAQTGPAQSAQDRSRQDQGGNVQGPAAQGGEQGYGRGDVPRQEDRPRPAMPRRDPGSGLRRDAEASGSLFGGDPAQEASEGGHNAAPVGPSPTSAWRASPNDELVRQAERVRKPAAGGITTSGLPRRVPRANLVPGTAQEQSTQTGPQVSRAPADVRGRLTNLRRGIQQGRSAGSGGTNGGGFDFGPSHQQERQ